MLKPCGDKPNCVCSRDARPGFHMDPIPFEGEAEAALDRAVAALKSLGPTKLIERRPGHVHMVAITRWLRFRDDVEFEIDQVAGVLHFRSASRIGYGDLGANRRRMKKVVAAMGAAAETT